MMDTDVTAELFARVVECADDSIIITTKDINHSQIIYVNPAFTRMTGYQADEVIGKTPKILQGPRTDRRVLDRLRADLTAGRIFRGQGINYRKDGSEFVNEWHIEPVRTALGEISHFLAIQRDVTDRKMAEAQLIQAQKVQAMGLMAAGVAHDFNNILSVIIGSAELATDHVPPGHPGREHVDRAMRAGIEGQVLTGRLLTFGRGHRGDREANVDINTVIDDAQHMLQHLINNSVVVQTRLESAPWLLRGDASRIAQVVINLSINARDAMPEGGALTIKTANVRLNEAVTFRDKTASPGRYIELTVSDTGTGMDAVAIQHLFEPFFTTKEAGKGTGLGLTIIKTIVDDYRGFLHVSSAPGQGTAFKVLFPVD